MSGRAVLDTNVLAYLFDPRDQRHGRAEALVRELGDRGDAVVSTQILVELYNVLTRKLLPRMPPDRALAAVTLLAQWEVVPATPALVLAALERSGRQQLSVWDALVLEAAATADCAILYSEDLQDGRDYGGVKVVNPFVKGEGGGTSSRA